MTLNGLYGIISQKMVLFITTGVRTSNPTMAVKTLFHTSVFKPSGRATPRHSKEHWGDDLHYPGYSGFMRASLPQGLCFV
jgi:hypothetical protein